MVLNKLQTDRMRHWLNLSSKTGKKLKKKKKNTKSLRKWCQQHREDKETIIQGNIITVRRLRICCI